MINSPFSIITSNGLNDISSDLLLDNGQMKLLSAKEYKKYPCDDFRLFCHSFARYGIPTIELIAFIKKVIDGRTAIEIGAGSGDLGYHLKIPMTDSKIQEDPTIKAFYESAYQPVIKYPDSMEKIEALEAVNKYKPQVVIASWITPYSPVEKSFGSSPFGIKEDQILKSCETLIIIGNLDVHHDKPIRVFEHKTVHAPWIISRAKRPEKNCIMIWDNRE